jgi:TRAP-type mannitol/chloroaromatic compound transport system permease small subunit
VGNAQAKSSGAVNGLAVLTTLRRRLERLSRLMGCAAGWVFVACAFFVTFDVISRKFAGFSTRSTTEITGYMLAFGLTWGMAHALATRSHIRVDMLVSRMPLRLRAYMHAMALVFLVAMLFFFLWRGWAVVFESWEFGARDTSALSIPLIVPQSLWAVGITVFFALAVVLLLEVVVSMTSGRADAVDRLLGSRTLAEETTEALEAAGVAHSRDGPGNTSAGPR